MPSTRELLECMAKRCTRRAPRFDEHLSVVTIWNPSLCTSMYLTTLHRLLVHAANGEHACTGASRRCQPALGVSPTLFTVVNITWWQAGTKPMPHGAPAWTLPLCMGGGASPDGGSMHVHVLPADINSPLDVPHMACCKSTEWQ